MEQLGAREDDYAVYAETSFDSVNRLLMISRDVSTKYTRRTPKEFERIASYIVEFVGGRKGNYLVYFPSYRMMEQVGEKCVKMDGEGKIGWILQHGNMSEQERENFLDFLWKC